jgi:peptidylprolyl isomerase
MRLKSLFALAACLLFAGIATAKTETAPAPVPSVAPPPATPDNIWNLDLSTGGRVSIQLRPDMAPNHVERIKILTRHNFYNGLIFHRVLDGFMAQGGDPTGTGNGGSQLPDLAAEFSILPHVRGTVAAARLPDNINSANSQFFIMFFPRMKLDNHYTVFGRVISGMNYVDAIERGEPPANPTRILRASIGSDNIPPPQPGEAIPGLIPIVVAAAPAPAPAEAAPAPAEAAPAPAEAAPAPAEAAPAPAEAAPAPAEAAPAPAPAEAAPAPAPAEDEPKPQP